MKQILAFLAVALAASTASCSPAEAATLDQLQHAHQVIFDQSKPATGKDVLFSYAGSMSADAAMMTIFDIVSVDNQVQRWQECPTAGGGRLLKGFNATGFLLVRGEVAKAKDGWQALLPAPDGHQCVPGSRTEEWPSYNYLVSHPSPNVKRLDVFRPAIDFYDAANLNDYASVMMMYEALLHAGFQADYWFACSTQDNGVLLTAYTTDGKPMISGQVTMGGKIAPSVWHAVAPVSAVCGHGPTLQAGWYDRHHFSK